MRIVRLLITVSALLFCPVGPLRAQTEAAPAPASAPAAGAPTAAEAQAATNTQAAAAVASGRAHAPRTPEFLENAVDAILEQFDVSTSRNTPTRYIVSAMLLLLTFLLRRVVTTILFAFLRKLASRTETTLDDKLFVTLEAPLAALVVVFGGVGAFKVLKLSESADHVLGYGYTVAFSLVVFWLFLRAFNTVLDHVHEAARTKNLGVAAFMPWIKKTLVVIVVIFGVLMIAQSLGADVKAFLAGLGIGGLAFALAAQDTLANIFGSVVVAVDQPFKIGEAVKIGAHDGVVEDIGLRSTKLRTPGKNLIVIPNKTVAAEAIVNNSRYVQRRVEQVLGLTYDTTAEQMEEIVAEFHRLIVAEEEVVDSSVMVYFRDYGASSLDIWIAYETKDPDFQKHMKLRQRLNLAMMRAIAARGLAFAFPTRTVQFDGPIAKRLAGDGEKKTES